MATAVIVDAVRTASGRGKPGGALSGIHPADLISSVIRDMVERTGIDPAVIDDVILGCVSQAGKQTFNIARWAALGAGLPERIPGVTVDRQCGSSQQAAMFAAQAIISGMQDVVIAGGIESMSANPIGYSLAGHEPYGDLVHDRYPNGLVNQGAAAELVTKQWGLSKNDLNEFSAESHRRAAAASSSGAFDREILPVKVPDASGALTLFKTDETIRATTTAEGLSGLPASFRTEELTARFPEIEWNITPGNSSPLTDGASAALIMSEDRAKELGLKPRARFHTFSVTGSDPLLMLTGVIPATRQALERSGLSLSDIDTFEVNEAFAPVPLAWLRETGVDPAKLNPRGGAIALGHPLGASGGRLLATMLHYLEDTGGRFGLQTMCEGGGTANATIIEVL